MKKKNTKNELQMLTNTKNHYYSHEVAPFNNLFGIVAMTMVITLFLMFHQLV